LWQICADFTTSDLFQRSSQRPTLLEDRLYTTKTRMRHRAYSASDDRLGANSPSRPPLQDAKLIGTGLVPHARLYLWMAMHRFSRGLAAMISVAVASGASAQDGKPSELPSVVVEPPGRRQMSISSRSMSLTEEDVRNVSRPETRPPSLRPWRMRRALRRRRQSFLRVRNMSTARRSTRGRFPGQRKRLKSFPA
jgi:hypothetical protein